MALEGDLKGDSSTVTVNANNNPNPNPNHYPYPSSYCAKIGRYIYIKLYE